MTNITPKQSETIQGLEDYFDIQFEGQTKLDAQKWIGVYLPRYRKSYGEFVAFYLFKNNFEVSDIRYDAEGRIILPTRDTPSQGLRVNLKNMVEYTRGTESTANRIMDRIDNFNNSVPSVQDIDNHIDYLTNVFKLTM